MPAFCWLKLRRHTRFVCTHPYPPFVNWLLGVSFGARCWLYPTSSACTLQPIKKYISLQSCDLLILLILLVLYSDTWGGRRDWCRKSRVNFRRSSSLGHLSDTSRFIAHPRSHSSQCSSDSSPPAPLLACARRHAQWQVACQPSSVKLRLALRVTGAKASCCNLLRSIA